MVKPFSKIFIDKKQKTEIISDIDSFIESKNWYTDRAIRYKRCYLLHGNPGNGKTSIAMALANYLSRDVYVLNINSLENDGALIRAFGGLGRNIVLLVEDIDRAFAKRENVDSKISFSSLLNSFDGALAKDGIITVVTTNHIDKLDEALIREGRCDSKYEIPNPSPEVVKDYLEKFFDVKISNEIEGSNYSMAYVQEWCIKHKDSSLAAINHFAKKKSA